MIETVLVARGRRHFPDGIFMSRSKINSKFYDSTSYARNSNGPNSYGICYYVNSEKKFGQIHYFVIMGEQSFRSGEKYACITKIDVIKPIGPYPMFYFLVNKTLDTDLIRAKDWEKVFFIQTDHHSYILEMCEFFDHQ